MEINRYLIDDKKNILNEETYSLDPNYYHEPNCECSDEDYCDCEGHEGMGCADYFTQYYNNRIQFNRLKIIDPNITSIKKDLPKLYFILSKLELEFEDDLTIKGKKQQLVLCFRIIRLTNENLMHIFNILYDYMKNKNIPIFQALLLTSIKSNITNVSHSLGINLLYFFTNVFNDNFIKIRRLNKFYHPYIKRNNNKYKYNILFTILKDEEYYRNIFNKSCYLNTYNTNNALYEPKSIIITLTMENVNSILLKLYKIILNFKTQFVSSNNQIELYKNFYEEIKNLKN